MVVACGGRQAESARAGDGGGRGWVVEGVERRSPGCPGECMCGTPEQNGRGEQARVGWGERRVRGRGVVTRHSAVSHLERDGGRERMVGAFGGRQAKMDIKKHVRVGWAEEKSEGWRGWRGWEGGRPAVLGVHLGPPGRE